VIRVRGTQTRSKIMVRKNRRRNEIATFKLNTFQIKALA
jgi:hypothetical protein